LGQQAEIPRPIAVLQIGRQHHDAEHQSEAIDQQKALSALYLLAGVVAAIPPFSVVCTDWLSSAAALGSGSRPCRTRSWRRSASLICSQVPSSRQRAKYQYTVFQLGRSWGSSRH